MVAQLPDHEQAAVMEVHLLAYVLDGDLSKREFAFWQRMCDAT